MKKRIIFSLLMAFAFISTTTAQTQRTGRIIVNNPTQVFETDSIVVRIDSTGEYGVMSKDNLGYMSTGGYIGTGQSLVDSLATKLPNGGYPGTATDILDSIQSAINSINLQETTENGNTTDQGIRITNLASLEFEGLNPPGNISSMYVTEEDNIVINPAGGVSSVVGRAKAQNAIDNDDLVPLGQLNAALGDYQLTSEKGQPNGYPELDGSGRVPIQQLPAEIVSLQGNWDASTNTPTLADGVGDIGDAYSVSVAGTQDLGSGPIEFHVNDLVIYNGSTWFRNSGLQYQNLTFSNGSLSISNGNSVDLDSRYNTKTEITDLLADKADKSTTITAGTWLQGGGDLSQNRGFNVVPLVNGWLLDSEGNQRMFFRDETNSVNDGIILKGSNPSHRFQFRNSDNLTVWEIGSSGTLNIGIVPWARLTGVPDFALNSNVVHLTGDETISGVKTFAQPLLSSYVRPNGIDGTGGSGDSISTGISQSGDRTDFPAASTNNVLTFKLNNGRTLELGSGVSISQGLWYRPLHTTNNNPWTRVWDSYNLPSPATETYVNNAISGLRYFGTSATTGTQIALNNAIDLDTLSLSNAFITTNYTNGPAGTNNGIVTNYSYQSGSYFKTFMDYGNNRLWFRGNSLTSLTNPWLEVAPKEWVNSQGFLTSPSTLQEVTGAGNVTDNAITITGSNNANFSIDGLFLLHNSGLNQIGSVEGGNINGSLIMGASSTGLQHVYNAGANSSGLDLHEETALTAGASFNTRISASSAINSNEVLTGDNSGFGMSWNATTSALDWGQSQAWAGGTLHYIEVPTGDTFSLGNLNSAETPFISTFKGTSNTGQTIVTSGNFNSMYPRLEIISNGTTDVGSIDLKITKTGEDSSGIEIRNNPSSGETHVTSISDFRVAAGNKLIVYSPDGTPWAISVDNSGNLTAVQQ